MADVLRSAGLACGHETTYTLYGYDPSVDTAVEVSWEAIFHLGSSRIGRDVVIAQQTRDPIAWLNSWLRMSEHGGDLAWRFLDEAIPGVLARHRDDPARTAMWLWVELNRRCEQYTRLRHRVEDLRTDLGVEIVVELARTANLSVDPDQVQEALTATDSRTNHHPGLPAYVPSTWGSLPIGPELDEFRSLARSYGYSTS